MKTTWFYSLIISTFFFSIASQAESRKQVATSGIEQVQFIELYSSESCSSCPPADKWFSEFKNYPGLWKTFIPIVFHVDYWNNLGWKDKLSSKEMTQRQVDVSMQWPKPSVYTPAVVANGKEWSRWHESKDHSLPEFKQQKSKIELTIYQEKNLSYTVKVVGVNKNEKYKIWIAQLGMGLTSKITSGENSGETFEHNFVVLHLDKKEILNNEAEENFIIPKTDKQVTRLAIVAWIEKDKKSTPLQAAGSYL